MVIFNAVVAPYMLNPAQGDLKGIAAFPSASMGLFCLIWTYFRLPETKGRTYTELDILFELGISARSLTAMLSTLYTLLMLLNNS